VGPELSLAVDDLELLLDADGQGGLVHGRAQGWTVRGDAVNPSGKIDAFPIV
jgi:hypothetical protein